MSQQTQNNAAPIQGQIQGQLDGQSPSQGQMQQAGQTTTAPVAASAPTISLRDWASI